MMQPPAHAIQLWLTADDQIMVCYPDGQQIAVPVFEPQRLVTILRTVKPREAPDKWLAERKFVAAFSEDAVKKAGTARRIEAAKAAEREQEKKEREKRARLKRADKARKLKEANELLAVCGLI